MATQMQSRAFDSKRLFSSNIVFFNVTYETVPLHLAKPEPAVPTTTLSGLPSKHTPGPRAAAVHFVKHHVLQLLVIHRAHVDVCLQQGMYEICDFLVLRG